ncbi:MAG: tripartite tricarboxylate transporter TctB family protein [Roseovarius sp.]
MSHIDQAAPSHQPGPRRYLRYLAEWAAWAILIGIYYQQTTYFQSHIENYDFGAASWPRVIALAALAGATFQLALQIHRLRSGQPTDEVERLGIRVPARAWLHRSAIFLWPFVFLYLAPRIGAYVAVPVFVLGLLLLLGVRRIKPLILVVAVVYGLMLVIFTRYFYVALPIGAEGLFYNINVAIIEFARIGR